MPASHQFAWARQSEAEALIHNVVEDCIRANPFIRQFGEELRTHTSTRLFDWVDHVTVGGDGQIETALEKAGFVGDYATSSYRVFYHPSAQLPRVVVNEDEPSAVGVAIKVDRIGDFLQVRGVSGWIEGTPYSGYRRCCISTENGVAFWVVERRLAHTMEPIYQDATQVERTLEAREKWQARPRDLENEGEAVARAIAVVEELVAMVGEDSAAWVVLECERAYWQVRNTAARCQKGRQDRLGLGWADHDHHTFRSSRKHFPQLVRLFEILGFHCRERFYAGEEAGWGAQVMENVHCGLVLFLDVDLASDEVEVDFAHHTIPELEQLGTVGLWCALHGDSILKGGMHHLAGQFLFENLTADLSHYGISMMEPFSDFSYLQQAFTHGEIWPVDPARVRRLVEKGVVTNAEADQFVKYGCVGSHLENLQRREGYKGFNKENVSVIIRGTDPRLVLGT